MACKTELDHCILKDDLAQVLQSVSQCDVLVMSTPVYYGEVSSQLKAFIDRTYSFLVPEFINAPNPSRLSPGKKLVFIQAQGYPDEECYDDIYPRYAKFFKWYGFDDSYFVRVCGVSNPDDAKGRDDIMNQTIQTAEKVVKG